MTGEPEDFDDAEAADEPDSMWRFLRSLIAYVVLAGASWLGVALVHQKVLHGALKAAAVLFSILAAWCIGGLLVMTLMAVRSVNRRRAEERYFDAVGQQYADDFADLDDDSNDESNDDSDDR